MTLLSEEPSPIHAKCLTRLAPYSKATLHLSAMMYFYLFASVGNQSIFLSIFLKQVSLGIMHLSTQQSLKDERKAQSATWNESVMIRSRGYGFTIGFSSPILVKEAYYSIGSYAAESCHFLYNLVLCFEGLSQINNMSRSKDNLPELKRGTQVEEAVVIWPTR